MSDSNSNEEYEDESDDNNQRIITEISTQDKWIAAKLDLIANDLGKISLSNNTEALNALSTDLYLLSEIIGHRQDHDFKFPFAIPPKKNTIESRVYH